jgi:hypothetical protein
VPASIGTPAALPLGCTGEKRNSIEPVPVSRTGNQTALTGQSVGLLHVDVREEEIAIKLAPL